tara:strand:+ start:463 stop:702 length:240 start_codon:yes stop_codon:yes gene_type:complete
MNCYKIGDLIKIPQNTMLFNEEPMHTSLLFPKSVTAKPYIGCVLTTEKTGELLKVFIKNEYFLVRAKDVHFAKGMANAC